MIDYSTDFEGLIPVITYRGSLTSIVSAPMPGIKELIMSGYKKIVLNASEITYINSSGLSSLVNTHRYCNKEGVHLVLAKPKPDVMKVIRVARANLFMPIYDDVESAVKDIQYHTGPSVRGSKSRERILIIQKNLQIGMDLETVLLEAKQSVNYELETETDLSKAIEMLKKSGYQLVIVDVNLEPKDAEGLLAAMSMDSDLSVIPVLVATPRSRYEQAYEFVLNGVDDFLPHPFDEFETPTRIRNLMELYYIAKADSANQQLTGLKLARSTKSMGEGGGLRHNR